MKYELRPNRSLLILISLTLLLGSVLVTQAAPSRSVGLLSFEATALESAVRLDWETATELHTAGFIVKRSINGGIFISLPDIGVPGFVDADGNPAGFIISEGGPAEGATYQEMDSDVQAGNSYIYKLVEVENDNSEVELDTQSVLFGSVPTHTPTTQPLITNTPTPIATAIATATSGNTSPPTATATISQAANNSTTNVVNTPAPTVSTSLPTTVPVAQSEAVVENSESGDEGLVNNTASTSVLAQAEATATAVPPTQTETTTNGDASYPGAQAQTEPTSEPGAPTPIPLESELTPYPVATRPVGEEVGTSAVPIIGSQSNDQLDSRGANSSQETPNRDQQLGRIYLWGGFLLSVLIFITTVVATILLFTRKRTQ